MNEFINEVLISFDLEIKSLTLPIEQLREKIQLLNQNLATILEDEKEYKKKLKQENKAIRDNYRDRLYQIKIEEEIKYEIDRFIKENTQRKYKSFKTELEKLFRKLIKEKLENSRITIEKEIKEKSTYLYNKILENFNEKINNIYKITSEVFNIELNKIHIDIEYNFPEEF